MQKLSLNPTDASFLFLLASSPLAGPEFYKLLEHLETPLAKDIARVMVFRKPESEYSKEDLRIIKSTAIEFLERIHKSRIRKILGE